jgi:hypothetical protein
MHGEELHGIGVAEMQGERGGLLSCVGTGDAGTGDADTGGEQGEQPGLCSRLCFIRPCSLRT